MRRIKQVLPSALNNEELLKVGRAQAVMRRWPEVVGPFLAERSHPDRFGRGTLWVAVQGSAWAQELRMMKEKILARLSEISGEPGLFKEIRFGVRPLPERFASLGGVAEGSKVEAPAARPSLEAGALEEENDVAHMTIREIAERRLKRWKDAGAD